MTDGRHRTCSASFGLRGRAVYVREIDSRAALAGFDERSLLPANPRDPIGSTVQEGAGAPSENFQDAGLPRVPALDEVEPPRHVPMFGK